MVQCRYFIFPSTPFPTNHKENFFKFLAYFLFNSCKQHLSGLFHFYDLQWYQGLHCQMWQLLLTFAVRRAFKSWSLHLVPGTLSCVGEYKSIFLDPCVYSQLNLVVIFNSNATLVGKLYCVVLYCHKLVMLPLCSRHKMVFGQSH